MHLGAPIYTFHLSHDEKQRVQPALFKPELKVRPDADGRHNQSASNRGSVPPVQPLALTENPRASGVSRQIRIAKGAGIRTLGLSVPKADQADSADVGGLSWLVRPGGPTWTDGQDAPGTRAKRAQDHWALRGAQGVCQGHENPGRHLEPPEADTHHGARRPTAATREHRPTRNDGRIPARSS